MSFKKSVNYLTPDQQETKAIELLELKQANIEFAICDLCNNITKLNSYILHRNNQQIQSRSYSNVLLLILLTIFFFLLMKCSFVRSI